VRRFSLPARGGLRPWSLPLLVRIIERDWLATRRSMQSRSFRMWISKAGVLTIRSGKFGKSRFDPTPSVDPSRAGRLPRATKPALGPPGGLLLSVRFPTGVISWITARSTERSITLSRQIGLRGPSDSHGPRIHDLRHRFAVMTLFRWYRSGKDVEQKVAILVRLPRTCHVSDTYWYLSAWPELMREAMSAWSAAGRVSH